MPKGYVPSEPVVEAVEQLLDNVMEPVAYGRFDEVEYETLCHICNEVGGHADDCFVPAVLAWQRAK